MPIRTFVISPVTTTNLLQRLSKNIINVFYKNYIHGDKGAAVLYNKNNVYNLIVPNTDQLYLTTTQSETVSLFKGATEAINYNDGRNFAWLFDNDFAVTNNANTSFSYLNNYLSATAKYNRMKLLLSCIETVILNDYTLETQVEFPLVLDFDYQML
jgi:hypothetical protein